MFCFLEFKGEEKSKMMKMMTRIRGVGNLFLIVLVVGCLMSSVHGRSLFELSSREDLVQMAGYGEVKLSTVLVSGTVVCEACLEGEDRVRSWPISGATVAVNCKKSEKKGKSNWEIIKSVTDEYGDFLIDIPSHLHANPNLQKTCQVKVIRLPKNSLCRPVNLKNHKNMILSSVGNGIRMYSTEDIKFVHSSSKPLQTCSNKMNDKNMI